MAKVPEYKATVTPPKVAVVMPHANPLPAEAPRQAMPTTPQP